MIKLLLQISAKKRCKWLIKLSWLVKSFVLTNKNRTQMVHVLIVMIMKAKLKTVKNVPDHSACPTSTLHLMVSALLAQITKYKTMMQLAVNHQNVMHHKSFSPTECAIHAHLNMIVNLSDTHVNVKDMMSCMKVNAIKLVLYTLPSQLMVSHVSLKIVNAEKKDR